MSFEWMVALTLPPALSLLFALLADWSTRRSLKDLERRFAENEEGRP